MTTKYNYGKFIATALPLIGAGVTGLDRLSAKMGMPRTPVYQRLRQMEADGLVSRDNGRGTLQLTETGQQMAGHIRLARRAENGVLTALETARG